MPDSALNLASVLPKHHTPRQIQLVVTHCQRVTYSVVLPKHHTSPSAQIYTLKMRRSGRHHSISTTLRNFSARILQFSPVETSRHVASFPTVSSCYIKTYSICPAEASHSTLNIFLYQKTRAPELQPGLTAKFYFRANRAVVSIKLIWSE